MKKTNKTVVTLIKGVGGIVIAIGVGAIVGNIIKATTPSDMKRITKFCILVGGSFTGSIAAGAASDQFSDTVDAFAHIIDKFASKDDLKLVTEGEA